MDPLAWLRTVRGRLAPRMEATAQVIAERVITLVVDVVDLNGLLDRVDVNQLVQQADLNARWIGWT